MLKVTIQDNGVSQRLKVAGKALANKVEFFDFWSERVVQEAQDNALAKGGTTFWKSVSAATSVASVTDAGALIVCKHVAGAQKQFGGPIRIKNKKALTIPINALARGKVADDFEAGGTKLFTPKGTNVLGFSEGDLFVGLYVLVKATKSQRPDPWFPSPERIAQIGNEEAEYLVKNALAGG